MSDNDPNKELNKKRIRVELSSMKLNLERFDLRLMEIEVEKIKVQENISSTNKKISELETTLQEN